MERRSRFDPVPRGFPRGRSPPPRRPAFEDDYVRDRRFQDDTLPPVNAVCLQCVAVSLIQHSFKNFFQCRLE